ncbi:Imm49 family immunity protein [Pasteurella atlantica]|uniref:Imm49 family immunity protein n=1 Tax=Pasteurellaceae TaxID=712 RepID=UPI00274FD297|nr:Imm49 family immunity protein [Pasteurella atlantica]MDP8100075.1 Imm49 family immunity protein [Pasteurella atlantica]MDP8107991.1 Imm49 family immunity protein [Pasteurella atlantica]MDP8117720.1 Imm49 family immunity protein [Pasteurella atlantica]
MKDKYKVFLGSETGPQTYEGWIEQDLLCDLSSDIREDLDLLNSNLGNSPACMQSLAMCHFVLAKQILLRNDDVKLFKQHCYTAAKLCVLGDDGWTITYDFFALMSDNQEIIDCVVSDTLGADYDKYDRKDLDPFFFKNKKLAVSSKNWEELKERSQRFLDDEKNYLKARKYKPYIPEHEFYVALCDGNVEGMHNALEKLLDLKIAKRRVRGYCVEFSWFLNVIALELGKIASIHGFDVDIDHPTAPKELMKYEPLEHYEDPYDFMKEYDFNKPHQEWIDMWQERHRQAKAGQEEIESKKLKNRILSWFKK